MKICNQAKTCCDEQDTKQEPTRNKTKKKKKRKVTAKIPYPIFSVFPN